MYKRVNLIKFDESMIGSYVYCGGISTATVLSKAYLDKWGTTYIDVIWDDEPGYVIRQAVARMCAIRRPGKDPNIDSLLAIYNS